MTSPSLEQNVNKYLRARWRKEYRYGFKLKIHKLKINELTPLKENGNNKRSNRWDED